MRFLKKIILIMIALWLLATMYMGSTGIGIFIIDAINNFMPAVLMLFGITMLINCLFK